MAGGFCALKDIPKTLVYTLSNYRNAISPVIPQRIIDRPPSAELSKDQTDQDTLPDYETLDKIIELYIEKRQSIKNIVATGLSEDIVKKIVSLNAINEYKRRQAPIGVRVNHAAFGRDRRYPITSGYKNYQLSND
jgi:NAD+ synthase (glutamine-hydrolysing)